MKVRIWWEFGISGFIVAYGGARDNRWILQVVDLIAKKLALEFWSPAISRYSFYATREQNASDFSPANRISI